MPNLLKMIFCIFCSLLEKKENILFEDNISFVVHDLFPKAKIHYLFIPKKHSNNLTEMSEEDMISFFASISKYLSNLKYKNHILQINSGITAGQEIFHTHIHIKIYDN